MHHRRTNLGLLGGLLASLLAHAVLLVPVIARAMSTTREVQVVQARFSPEDFTAEDLEPPPPDEPMPGIDAKTPSSLTWIGYDEYEKHVARLAEVEQAAFTDRPVPAGAPAQPAAAVEPVTEPPPEPTEAAPEPVAAPTTSVLATAELLHRLLAGAESAAVGDTPEPADTETVAQSSPPPTPTPPTATPAPRPQPPAPDEPEPKPGDPAERESDATSIIEVAVEDLKPGKPLARPGLELLPRRPRFTALMKATAAPGDPLVEIRFGPTGRPARAEILQSSGDGRMDRAIEASLYRWRARGKKLQEIGPGETVDMRIRIVLNSRRRR